MLTLVLVCTGDHYYCYGSRLTTELGAAGTHLSTESLHASTTPCRVVQCVCVCVCVCMHLHYSLCPCVYVCAVRPECAEKEEVARAHWHKSPDGAAAAARGAQVRSCSEGDGTSSADTDMDAPGRCPRAEWRRAVLAHPLGAIRRKARQRAARQEGEREREIVTGLTLSLARHLGRLLYPASST